MWDLSSQTRDWTCISGIERWVPNHCTTREVPPPYILNPCALTCLTDSLLLTRVSTPSSSVQVSVTDSVIQILSAQTTSNWCYWKIWLIYHIHLKHVMNLIRWQSSLFSADICYLPGSTDPWGSGLVWLWKFLQNSALWTWVGWERGVSFNIFQEANLDSLKINLIFEKS